MREIILIRHGKTFGNTLGRYIGTTDEELCLEGREELAALRESGQYRSIRPDLVYVSPLRRCRQTAEILFPGVPQEICRDFRECDFGEFENKNYKELSGNPAYQAWVDSGGTLPFPGGESREAFQERCRAEFARVLRARRKQAGSSAAFVVHGGTIMSILAEYAVPKEDFYHWQIKNGEGYACGAVGEMAADLNRYEKRHAVITGVVEGGDPEAQKEIEDWCRAAQVRRRFRDTNIAQIGRPYPGMMDLYIDESNLYRRMGLYTKQFDWEKMWAIADNITDEDAIRSKAQDIIDTFDIEGGGTVEKVWDMAKYVVAFEKWVKEEKLGLIASHYDGFATGKAGVLDSMLIPAFSMLIKQGTACAVEGDMKVAMAMSIMKTISGTGQLAEMYSIDFNEDIAIIGHSGSGDADISSKKPTMKIVKVFHGKTGGGYLTQFYPHLGPVTYLAITQDGDGHFKFIVAEGVNEDGKILSFGDTNMRTRFTCGAKEFVTRWSEAGPTHHFAAGSGRHIDTILKVAKILNVPVEIITR